MVHGKRSKPPLAGAVNVGLALAAERCISNLASLENDLF
jgi:hypothetical protein